MSIINTTAHSLRLSADRAALSELCFTKPSSHSPLREFLLSAWSGEQFQSNRPVLTTLPQLLDGVMMQGTVDKEALMAKGIAPMVWFDFDGTLIDEGSGERARQVLLERHMALPAVRPILDRLMPLFGLAQRAEAATERDHGVNVDSRRFFDAYQRWEDDGSISPAERIETTAAVYEFFSTIWAGHHVDTLRAIAQEVAERLITPSYFAGAIELVHQLRVAGIEVGVISATGDPLLREFVKPLNLREEFIAGMPVEIRDNIVQPRLRDLPTYRGGKVHAGMKMIQKLLRETETSWRNFRPLLAGGDSPSKTDTQLLEAAHFALVIAPETENDHKATLQIAATGKPVALVRAERAS